MDRTKEEIFVKRYIKESSQARLLFELFSQKHRKKALSRFAHGADRILKSGYQKIGVNDLSFLRGMKSAYVIPSDGNVDGAERTGEEIYAICSREASPVVVIGDGFAAVREEFEQGAPAIYLFR